MNGIFSVIAVVKSMPAHIMYLVAFAGALIVSFLSAPAIISIAGRRQLFDEPDNRRKLHAHTVPSLGGVAIFFSYIIVTSLVVQPAIFDKWHYFVAASLLFFLTGLMDDLVTLSAWKKLLAQLIPTCIVVVAGDMRIESVYGFLGIGPLSYYTSISITIFSCLFFTNAFNFIDGIDGLAGTMGTLYTAILGSCLALTGNAGAACIAFSLSGATAGFLRYNITPARLFMGDTGSLLLGFTISILSIVFVNSYNPDAEIRAWLQDGQMAVIFCLALLSLPIADCIRVFLIRISRGVSPFHADRNHLHYFLLDTGLNDLQATMLIFLVNLLVMAAAWLLQPAGGNITLLVITILILLNFGIVYLIRRRHTGR